eukprot:10445829-Ditylum_brightwellii.AAC.1
MNLKENKITIDLLDADNMYLSSHLSLIKQAIRYYAKSLSEEDKFTLKFCLPMIAYGMQTTLTRLEDQYFNYKGTTGKDSGEANADDNGLAIGLFEAQ